MASEVSCRSGLSLIWVTGSNRTRSKTAVLQCIPQGSEYSARFGVFRNLAEHYIKYSARFGVFRKVRSWAQYFPHCISMICIDPFDSDIKNVPATVNRELVEADNWLKANRLSRNVIKASYMKISNQKNSCDSIKTRDFKIFQRQRIFSSTLTYAQNRIRNK